MLLRSTLQRSSTMGGAGARSSACKCGMRPVAAAAAVGRKAKCAPTTTPLPSPHHIASTHSPACGAPKPSRNARRSIHTRAMQQDNPSSSSSASSTLRTHQAEAIRAELKELEKERDEAVTAAEACAKSGAKLADMATLMEQLALEKVRNGDEDGAREVLREKASVREALEKNTAKAEANYQLAQRLAPRIAQKQEALLAALRPSNSINSSNSSTTATTSNSSSSSNRTYPPTGGSYSQPRNRSSGSVSGSSASWGAGPTSSQAGRQAASSSSSGGSGSGSSSSSYTSGYGTSSSSSSGSSGHASSPSSPSGSSAAEDLKWKWQQSLEDATSRLREQEDAARREGRLAEISAQASIAEAQARLRSKSEQGMQQAVGRLQAARSKRVESLEEARARLRARDAEVLEYVRRVMARYRRGDYVSEAELEFAFQQLETRFTQM